MTAPIDILVRDITINGTPVGDGRMIVTTNGDGVIIGRPGGTPTVISRMIAPTVTVGPNNTYTATDGLNTWVVRRDTRCGSCGGRPTLARLDPAPLIAAAFA